MQKTVVLNIVGLTRNLIGPHTPRLRDYFLRSSSAAIGHVSPAVTCSVQSTYLTGKWPSEHGIVGNGWYYRDECEIKFWRQSNKLVHGKKIWDVARELDPSFTCANICWWFAMYSGADFTVTPRPMYPADGRKLPDIWTHPAGLRDLLQQRLGQFPLFKFWGPGASIESTQWIADAAIHVNDQHDPTLSLVYLPHLDYVLQKEGPTGAGVTKELALLDAVVGRLIDYFESKGAVVVVLSEYGITKADQPVHLNRVLRSAGLLAVREELGRELLDAGASAAFAVADHQIAHVYVNDPQQLDRVQALLSEQPGVGQVLGGPERGRIHLDHPRAGDLVVLAKPGAWFTYYYWLDDARMPDFARTVDIHRKPGYDPVELFLDPAIAIPKLKVAGKLLKKKLGFRYMMDVIPTDASLVRGTHGLPPVSPEDGPIVFTRQTELLTTASIEPTAISDLILAHLQRT